MTGDGLLERSGSPESVSDSGLKLRLKIDIESYIDIIFVYFGDT